MAKFACRCCDYLTLSEEPTGTCEICPVCYWEDDPVQSRDLTFCGGANIANLEEARENFKRYGACEDRVRPFVRPPLPEEIP